MNTYCCISTTILIDNDNKPVFYSRNKYFDDLSEAYADAKEQKNHNDYSAVFETNTFEVKYDSRNDEND